jgi:hypothetical protein
MYKGRNVTAVCTVVERRAVIVANRLNNRLWGRAVVAVGFELRVTKEILRRSAEVTSPIGSSNNVPGNPMKEVSTPATIGPRKKPALPPDRKIPIELPMELVFDFATAEKAGG